MEMEGTPSSLRVFSSNKNGHGSKRTKRGSKVGGEFTYPKMVPLVLTHSQIGVPVVGETRKLRW